MPEDQRRHGARTFIPRGLSVATLLVASPVIAQDRSAPAPAGDDIVVVGQKDQEKMILDFVRKMTRSPGIDSLARRDSTDSCPQTFGLAPGDNDALTARIRRVAAAAKINLAPADCHRFNVVVVFVNDKKAMVERLRTRTPRLFLDDRGDRIRIGKVDGPAIAWHVKGKVDRDNRLLDASDDEPVSLNTTASPSRIQAMVRPVYLTSMVLIERKGVVGLTASHLADYAAMRAYTDASPERAGKIGAPTILTVLTAPMESATPRSMTAGDFALLKGLYAAPNTLYSSAQQGAIANHMKHQLGGDDRDKRR